VVEDDFLDAAVKARSVTGFTSISFTPASRPPSTAMAISVAGDHDDRYDLDCSLGERRIARRS